ncbi:hypothetical protein N0V91_002817 [Didymella pomorum]|uniref:Uncharacterized protein n=1 Tax=Didymella pomorum TaxID=749634 RepID=A0A9W8ZK62_9PLEO|nr:hypothetical protein N0V91_002817 [Didymella pomorum]
MVDRNFKQEAKHNARSSFGRVARLKTAPKTDAQPRSYCMKRYKNSQLNLEKTPDHPFPVVQANANSPLLRLSPEIRNKIWDYACGGHLVLLHET